MPKCCASAICSRVLSSAASVLTCEGQAGVEQRNQSGNVGRIKHHDHMLHVGTIVAEVFAELRGDLGVAFQQVFARHARFAGGPARRNDVSAPSSALRISLV